MRRLLLGISFLFGAVGVLVVMAATANPASAVERTPLVLDGPKVEADYGALVGDNAAAPQAQDPTPADCGASAPPAAGTPAAGKNDNVDNGPSTSKQVTYCDNIPIVVKPPTGLTVFDSWFVFIETTWDRSQPGGCPADPVLGLTPCNDLDSFSYDDRALSPSTYTDTGKSATGDEPELIKIFQPNLGTYNLVINNFAGVNRGYHVTVTRRVFKGQQPFELLAPGINLDNGAGGASGSGSSGTSADASSANNPAPIDYGAGGPALDTAGIAPDAAFADFPIPTDQFNAPAKGPSLLGNLIAAEAKPPKAVSGLILVLTMLLLPLLLVSGGVGWAYKRSRSAFTF